VPFLWQTLWQQCVIMWQNVYRMANKEIVSVVASVLADKENLCTRSSRRTKASSRMCVCAVWNIKWFDYSERICVLEIRFEISSVLSPSPIFHDHKKAHSISNYLYLSTCYVLTAMMYKIVSNINAIYLVKCYRRFGTACSFDIPTLCSLNVVQQERYT